MNLFKVDELILKAFEEDFNLSGDITSENIFLENDISNGEFIAKDSFIFCGRKIAERIYELIDSSVKVEFYKQDGDFVNKGDIIGIVSGKTISLLKAERIVLNFVQHMSGISTQVNSIVQKINKNISVVDTRKTLPGLRIIQKYAVLKGGGKNHRFGLYDAVMLKENHIYAAGGIKNAIDKVKKNISHVIKIEVETETLEDVIEAVENKADIIMLDNMNYELMQKCCEIIGKKALIEVSGNITPDTIKDRLRDLPVNIVSLGSITHSVKACDISF
ncbi:MAG: carboxylating nicotinate-nucleotide diphosphorylase, partial [Candidatus Muirbacterium halophilum]|nr:carboxylating nicotinate-nucleotide diphosphorylase [Candidatus Muirbacterium halophilum]